MSWLTNSTEANGRKRILQVNRLIEYEFKIFNSGSDFRIGHSRWIV